MRKIYLTMFLLCISAAGISSPVFAQADLSAEEIMESIEAAKADAESKYGEQTTEEPVVEEEVCTEDDLKEIESFDRKATRKAKDLRALIDETKEDESRINEKKSKNRYDDIKKAQEFFSSSEYKEMRPVYKRCDKQMPTQESE